MFGGGIGSSGSGGGGGGRRLHSSHRTTTPTHVTLTATIVGIATFIALEYAPTPPFTHVLERAAFMFRRRPIEVGCERVVCECVGFARAWGVNAWGVHVGVSSSRRGPIRGGHGVHPSARAREATGRPLVSNFCVAPAARLIACITCTCTSHAHDAAPASWHTCRAGTITSGHLSRCWARSPSAPSASPSLPSPYSCCRPPPPPESPPSLKVREEAHVRPNACVAKGLWACGGHVHFQSRPSPSSTPHAHATALIASIALGCRRPSTGGLGRPTPVPVPSMCPCPRPCLHPCLRPREAHAIFRRRLLRLHRDEQQPAPPRLRRSRRVHHHPLHASRHRCRRDRRH